MNSNWSYSPETLNFGQNRRFFVPCDIEIWPMTLKNNRAPILCCFKICASFHSYWLIQTWVTVRKRPNLVKIDVFFQPCDLAIWRMTLKYYRAPLVSNIKLCASFHCHWWIQTWVTVRKRPNLVKIDDFLSRVTLKFKGSWPWKTIGHFFYTTLSFLQHFKAMGEFNLELQSGNAQFWSKSTIFCPVWPWNLTYDLEKQ